MDELSSARSAKRNKYRLKQYGAAAVKKATIPTLSGEFSQYYSIGQYANGLRGVRFTPLGVERLVMHYQKKYQIGIIKNVFFADNDSQSLFDAVKTEAGPLKDGEIMGLYCISTDVRGFHGHTLPIIIAKREGRIIVVDFKDEFKAAEGKEYDFSFAHHIKKPRSSKMMQKDFESCWIFTLNMLVNSLRNEEFCASCFTLDDKVMDVKAVMGQGSEYIKMLDKNYSEKYVHEFRSDSEGKKVKPINLKSFYKGHYYALLLNPNHFEFVDRDTSELFFMITRKRIENKAKRGISVESAERVLLSVTQCHSV